MNEKQIALNHLTTALMENPPVSSGATMWSNWVSSLYICITLPSHKMDTQQWSAFSQPACLKLQYMFFYIKTEHNCTSVSVIRGTFKHIPISPYLPWNGFLKMFNSGAKYYIDSVSISVNVKPHQKDIITETKMVQGSKKWKNRYAKFDRQDCFKNQNISIHFI